MEQVVVALGSNLGDRLESIRKGGRFLERLAGEKIRKSSIWESEPVGPARYPFLNAAALIGTPIPPQELLSRLKEFESSLGRDESAGKWGPRIVDLDIIACGNLVLHTQNLIIPHPEYRNRLFVLLPMEELLPDWIDPGDGTPISRMTREAPAIMIRKRDDIW